MATTTEMLAAEIGVRPQTLRAALCRFGHYYGVRPSKLPNGRLLWPDDAKDRLIAAGSKSAEASADGRA